MTLPPICDNGRKPEPPMRSESTKLTTVAGSFDSAHTPHSSHSTHSAHTLQVNRKKPAGPKQTYNSLQRHSSGNIDYNNVENCASSVNGEFARSSRSRTLGDGLGKHANDFLNS